MISDFLVFGDEFTDTYLVGASQKAVKRYQWSSLFIWNALNTACNRNNAYLCLDKGVESYKQRWASRRVPCYEMILGRDPVSWSFY